MWEWSTLVIEYTSWNVQPTCLQLTPAPRYQFWIVSACCSSCLLMCNIYHVVNRWGPSSVTFLRQGFWTRVSACFRHIVGFYWTCCQDGSDDVLYPFYLQHTHTHTLPRRPLTSGWWFSGSWETCPSQRLCSLHRNRSQRGAALQRNCMAPSAGGSQGQSWLRSSGRWGGVRVREGMWG